MVSIIERAKKQMRTRSLKNQDFYDLLGVYPNYIRGTGGKLRREGGSVGRPARRISAWPAVSGPHQAGCTGLSGETEHDRATAKTGGQPTG